MTSFTKKVNPRLAKRPLVFNGRLDNRGLTSLVKETIGIEHALAKLMFFWVFGAKPLSKT